MTARNTLNAFQAEEIDVAFWNDGDPAGLGMFDHILLVECKNWTSPTGYPKLAVFNDKLTSRGRPMHISDEETNCGLAGGPGAGLSFGLTGAAERRSANSATQDSAIAGHCRRAEEDPFSGDSRASAHVVTSPATAHNSLVSVR